MDTRRSTARLLYSFGVQHPIAFLSRFSIGDIVPVLDQLIAELARLQGWPHYGWSCDADECLEQPREQLRGHPGERQRWWMSNPPGYLWRLLEDREEQGRGGESGM